VSASAALRAGWKIAASPRADDLGVNNRVWQVGRRFWLHCYHPDDLPWRERQARLVEALGQVAAREGAGLRVPQTVPPLGGGLFHRDEEGAWQLTHNVPGRRPDPLHGAEYPAVAAGLARLHRLLARIDPSLAPAPTTLRGDLRANLARHRAESGDAAFAAMVEPAVERVEAWLPRLLSLPVQVIHGDFSHPNLKLAGRGAAAELTGVIDFEFCSADPAVLDLATVVLTLLLRGPGGGADARIGAMLDAYAAAGGVEVGADDLWPALLARKLDSYWHHGERARRDPAARPVAERQVEQLRRLLGFLDAR
jgi:Ser/Thr protein kinase RdoA (MazF antagonist)